MTVKDAHDFIDAFSQKTGRLPWFYSGITVRDVLGTKKDTLFGQCKLWLAGYVTEDKLKVQASWKDWTLWQYQYAEKQKGPTRPVPGYGLWDRSVFDGTQKQLEAIWAS
jgi:GH25 family lysozyme M1 (1,4-beta-N-acetylmuramidase)